MDDTALIQAFHLMWDNFPGMARLINKKHIVLAANSIAEKKGFIPGTLCAKVNAPDIQRGCKMAAAFKTGQAKVDTLLGDRLRGWLPVEGHPDVLVHFAIMLPDTASGAEPARTKAE